MSILDTLAQDHRSIETMFESLATLASQEPDARRQQFTAMQSLLQAHARAEEEVVYRVLRSRMPAEVKVLEAYEEHHIADVLLQELASDCPGGPGWNAKIRVLHELVRHHIKQEELILFALLHETFSTAEMWAMAQDFDSIKHERIETLLGPMRMATPAFAGRAIVTAQAAAGRFARRGELYLRRRLTPGRLRVASKPPSATSSL